MAQANGIAGIESNTVMFGWSGKEARRAERLRIIEQLATLGISAVIRHPRNLDGVRRRRRIDVWWGGLQANGDKLALFAHLISLNPEWRDAAITVKSIATSEMMLERNRLLLERVIHAARIDAQYDVTQRPAEVPVMEMITAQSKDADVVLMGLRKVKPGEEMDHAARLTEFVEALPTVLFVRSAGEFRGRLLGEQPDNRTIEPQEAGAASG